MTQTAEIAPPRRERKKRATRSAIRRVALELALERGVGGLTVEDISEAADVSPRTFFNYFACKEDALVGESDKAAAELREAILARPDGESPLRTLRIVLGQSDLLRAAHADREHALARQRLVNENPSLLPRQLAKYAAIERALADAIALRLAVDRERDLRPALLAALAVTVVRVAMQRWTAGSNREPRELVDEGFELLESQGEATAPARITKTRMGSSS